MAVNFVGAIDVDGQVLHRVGIKHRDAERPQTFGAGHRAGHRARDLVFDGGQCVNEKIHRGPGPHADQGPALHVLQGGLSDQGFELVLRGRAGGCVHGGKSPLL